MSKCECKECLHYELCDWLEVQYGLDKVDNCHFAKSKSLFVELPCKVGDDVWFYKAEIEELCVAKVIKIETNYFTPSTPLHITIQYKSNLIGIQETKMDESTFNLLCNKSKEEAEAKLKEVQNGKIKQKY